MVALHDFLDEHRSEILNLTHAKIAATSPRGSDAELIDSLPELFDDIVAVLRADAGLRRETSATKTAKTATEHGRQRLHLGFTITELVHDYAAMGSAITSIAEQTASIEPREYQLLNNALDGAIAESVSEYSGQRELELGRRQNERAAQHLGFIVHELRNALGAAMLSFEVIKRGEVSVSGRTGQMLERSLARAQALVDRSLAEVRMRSNVELAREATSVRDLLEDVEITTAPDAQTRHTRVVIEGASSGQVDVDRALMTSALANLVQNGIKYSPPNAEVHVRCRLEDHTLKVEVEDQCGGLPEGTIGELFTPFVRGRERNDATGLGLGLPITRQAIEAHGGHIHARSIPGKGCVFVVELPA